MTPEISVIIPTRNRAGILAEMLSRLADQTLATDRYEVVVVDDASEDDTPAILRTSPLPNLTFARLATRAAAAAARNRAISLARGRILLFLDDDAFVAGDFVEHHLASHARSPQMVTTGPIVAVADIPAPHAKGSEPIRGWHRNPFPSGNASVHRDLVEQAGLFDEGFTLYGWEDPELYERLRPLGVKRHFCRRAPIYHYKPPGEASDFRALVRREQERGQMGALFHARHRRIGVGFATKQLPAIIWLDRQLDRLLGLDRRLASALTTNSPPRSGLMRGILLAHAEIEAGTAAAARLRSGQHLAGAGRP